MTLSPSDLDRLESLARAATPGKRRDNGEQDSPGYSVGIGIVGGETLVRVSDGGPDLSTADALFIAACDPETILALVSEVRELRKETTCDCGRPFYARCGVCDNDE